MSLNRQPATSPLWAITSYFNPLGWRRRPDNYRVFAQHLRRQLPLATIEWSIDGNFELGAQDADLLVQVQGGDLMWQKERLLNLLVPQLPSACTAVAWVDADVLLERADWPEAALQALQQHAVVQLFSDVRHLGPLPMASLLSDGPGDALSLLDRVGLVSMIPPGTVDKAAWFLARPPPMTPAEELSPGFGWAASRDWLRHFPLFDAWVIGGGDSAYCHALLGSTERVVQRHSLGPAQCDAYLPRAERMKQAAGGRIGFISGRISTLWHGELESRSYIERHKILARHGFDPSRSISLAESGVWQWTDEGRVAAGGVREYLLSRREDG